MFNKAIILGTVLAAIAAPAGDGARHGPGAVPATGSMTGAAGVQAPSGIDPIITGERVTAEMLRQWEKRNAEFERCGECRTPQPFPDDVTAANR